jgi:hypothetical protein
MRSHISVQRATTKYFSNSFVFKNFITRLFSKTRLKRRDFQEIVRLTCAQEVSGSNPDAPTKTSRIFSLGYQKPLHPKLPCGIPLDRRSGFASRLVSESSPDAEHVKTRVGRSAIQKLLSGGKLSARHLPSMGKIMGTLCISRLIDLRKCKSVITQTARNYSVGLLFKLH